MDEAHGGSVGITIKSHAEFGGTMGYSTDFVGWVQIDPPLNPEETEYL